MKKIIKLYENNYMKFTISKVNWFLLFKIPSAYFAGVRTKSITDHGVEVYVKHRWINQNPFGSMYWAVQGMASELTTGLIVMRAIHKKKIPISMLVTNQTGTFTKKAKGRIIFTCTDIKIVEDKISSLSIENPTTTFKLTSIGIDSDGDQVSNFEYEWSLKLK